jgi:hypothetical protein
MEAVVLEGGIRGWVLSGAANVEQMEGYDEKAWRDEDKQV